MTGLRNLYARVKRAIPIPVKDLVKNIVRPIWTLAFRPENPHSDDDGGGDANREVESTVFGYSMRLNLGEGIQNAISKGGFEPEETLWVQEILEPGMTVIDVGANVGYFSLLAANRVGASGRVVSFEPSRGAFMRLKDVVARNNISQITPIAAALGDQPGSVDLVLQAENLHSPSIFAKNGVSTESVPVLRLDDYLKEHQIGIVDFMKLDVEGYEPNVLHGAAEALKNGRIKALLCELNDGWLIENQYDSERLHAEILAFGFRVEKTVKALQYPFHSNTLYVLGS